MDATTMRASTVTRSMPTSETRTHASITIPLSRTRSRTSMRELPLGERSTAISAYSVGKGILLLPARRALGRRGKLLQALFDTLETTLEVARKKRARLYRCQPRVMAPPVQPNLLRLVDGADEQPHLNGEQLDVREVDLDVTGNHQPFVQHAIENLDQSVTARWGNEIRQAGALRRLLSLPLLAGTFRNVQERGRTRQRRRPSGPRSICKSSSVSPKAPFICCMRSSRRRRVSPSRSTSSALRSPP